MGVRVDIWTMLLNGLCIMVALIPRLITHTLAEMGNAISIRLKTRLLSRLMGTRMLQNKKVPYCVQWQNNLLVLEYKDHHLIFSSTLVGSTMDIAQTILTI
nr:hypothetical protein Iba_chr14fCG4690 [Ipomoea batatas]